MTLEPYAEETADNVEIGDLIRFDGEDYEVISISETDDADEVVFKLYSLTSNDTVTESLPFDWRVGLLAYA